MAILTTLKQGFIRQEIDLVPTYITVKLDFDTYNVGSTDTFNIADLPVAPGKYLVPLFFSTNVTTADGETATCDFGLKPTTGSTFTADPNGLDDTVNLNSAVVSQGVIGTDAQMGARIDLTTGATLYGTPAHALEDGVAYVTLGYILHSY